MSAPRRPARAPDLAENTMHSLPHLRAPSGRLPMPVAATIVWVTVVLTVVAGLALLSGGDNEAPMLHAAAPQAAPAPATDAATVPTLTVPAHLDDALPEELPPTF